PTERAILTTLAQWGYDAQITEAESLLILIAQDRTAVHADLRTASSRYHWLALDLPDEAERRQYVDWALTMKDAEGKPVTTLDAGLTPAQVAAATAGL